MKAIDQLAIDTYQRLELTDQPDLLNLAWTLDERDVLAVDLRDAISAELQAEVDSDLAYVDTYSVKDPYGHDALGPAVADFFSLEERPAAITCGAGVTSLLHAISRLAASETVYVAGEVYPDFPYWVRHMGGRCVGSVAATAEDHLAAAAEAKAAIVFCERPSLRDEHLADLSLIETLCHGVAAFGALVIVDESNANYCPPRFSAVGLVGVHDSLVVLRGLSKAYGLGGLRLGYCVTSESLSDRIRSVVPPLLASSLSLRIGRMVLGLGDICDPLRASIAAGRQDMRRLFAAAGVEEVSLPSAHLPYVLLGATPERIRAQVESRGIRGKMHRIWSRSDSAVTEIYRLSVPLTARRMESFRERMAGSAPA